jgi:hypothetical protein
MQGTAQRQALPARAGFGGQNHQIPIRLLGLNPESVGECPHLSGARGVGRFWQDACAFDVAINKRTTYIDERLFGLFVGRVVYVRLKFNSR